MLVTILERYFVFNVVIEIWYNCLRKTHGKAKEAAGQKIECMDGDFEVHQSILINSDILWDFFEGKIQDFW